MKTATFALFLSFAAASVAAHPMNLFFPDVTFPETQGELSTQGAVEPTASQTQGTKN